MKVFLFCKGFQCEEEEIEKIELREKHKIEELTINNPCNSHEIYVIHSIKIIHNNYNMSNELKKITLFSSEDLKEKSYIREKNLNIYFNPKEKKKYIMELQEAEFNNCKCDNVIEVLKEYFVIILPGGSIGLTFLNPLEEINCIIKFNVKSIKDS